MSRQLNSQIAPMIAGMAVVCVVALFPPPRTIAQVRATTTAAPTKSVADVPLVDPARPLVDQIGIKPKLGVQLPLELEFVDAAGKPLQLRDCFAGRPVILHLVYYDCPMLCKLSADGLFRTLSTLALKPSDDFSIVTLSFDPSEGPGLSASARQMAAERVGEQAVKGGWHFLTGEEDVISAITDAVGFRYAYDEKTRQFAHASGVFVVTPDGRLSRFLTGIDYSPRDLRLALVEASGGKVGTATDQVMLLCYMYDPITGKYGLAIMSLLRAAGVATVCCLATAIVAMLRHERRRTAASQSPQPDGDELFTWND
jgi:protein SCO1